MPTLETPLSLMAFKKTCFRQRQTGHRLYAPTAFLQAVAPLLQVPSEGNWYEEGRLGQCPEQAAGEDVVQGGPCSCQPRRPVTAQGPVPPWGEKIYTD